MMDGVSDGGGGADDADFANAFRAHGIDVRVVLLDPGHVNRANISIGRDVVGGEVVIRVPCDSASASRM
jgi:hypothetical protein